MSDDNIHVNIDNLNTDVDNKDIKFICIDGVNKDIDNLSDDDLKYLLDNAQADDKGNKILSDDVVAKYYKRLPEGTRNVSKSRRVYNGGLLNDLSSDSEWTKALKRKGAIASQAKQEQRRTFADTLKYMLRCPAKRAQIEALGLDEGATQQDAITAAMILQAADGNRGAAEFVRDTVGERPADVSDVSLHTISDADRSLIDKVRQRLDRAEEQEESGGENETE